MKIKKGTILENIKTKSLYKCISKPYKYEATYDGEIWLRVKARNIKTNRLDIIRVDNFIVK